MSDGSVNWKTKAYLVGAALGAVVGLGAAYLYVSSTEEQGDPPKIQPQEAFGIGLAVVAALRQIASLRGGDKKKLKK